MTRIGTKEHILKNARYAYNFDRQLYLNRETKKAFSVQFLQDHPEEEIERHIRQDTHEKEEWTFFFNDPPSEAVRRELATVLG